MITVLITGCSMHSVDLIDVLRENYDHEPVRVIGINCEDTALLRKGVDAGYIVPRITEPDYVPTLLDICRKERVDVVFPFITAELPIAAWYKEELERNGVKVSVSSPESLEMTGNKISLARRYPGLMPTQLVIPRNSKMHEQLGYEIRTFAKSVGYPEKEICIKIPDGCGGMGFAIASETKGMDLTIYGKFGIHRYITLDYLIQLAERCDRDIILQEYEEGLDYSMCILADRGKLLYGLGFEAYLMAFGSAMFAKIADNDAAMEIAEKIVSETGLDGNACFDFILKKDGSVKLLEVNPRLSATLPFIAKAGLNLPYLRVKQLLGSDVSGMKFDIIHDLRMSKNYESEYFK